MTIATQLRENHSLLNWILIRKPPCPLLSAEMKLPNNVSVVKSLHLHQFELAEEIEHGVRDTDKENKMHNIVQENVADEDDVEFDNKYEGDEINGDDIRSLNSILNENDVEVVYDGVQNTGESSSIILVVEDFTVGNAVENELSPLKALLKTLQLHPL